MTDLEPSSVTGHGRRCNLDARVARSDLGNKLLPPAWSSAIPHKTACANDLLLCGLSWADNGRRGFLVKVCPRERYSLKPV